MTRTKREYILATFFLSGAAAILSFVSLGTEGWVTAKAIVEDDKDAGSSIKFGLFAGTFYQQYGYTTNYYLTMVCRYDLNVCALLCGENMGENLKKLYYHEENNATNDDMNQCTFTSSPDAYNTRVSPRADGTNETERVFINTGVWLCTILFLILSAVMGLLAAGLAVWNTATSPPHICFGIISLYVYNGIAFFSVLLSILLWGAMYVSDLIDNIPCYKTFLEGYSTSNNAQLGYSYWILLVSLFFYLTSMCLLFIRYYVVSREPKIQTVEIENDDARIYLY